MLKAPKACVVDPLLNVPLHVARLREVVRQAYVARNREVLPCTCQFVLYPTTQNDGPGEPWLSCRSNSGWREPEEEKEEEEPYVPNGAVGAALAGGWLADGVVVELGVLIGCSDQAPAWDLPNATLGALILSQS